MTRPDARPREEGGGGSSETADSVSGSILYIGIQTIGRLFCKKFKFFRKKDAKIFAGSKKVATFASAFEK